MVNCSQIIVNFKSFDISFDLNQTDTLGPISGRQTVLSMTIGSKNFILGIRGPCQFGRLRTKNSCFFPLWEIGKNNYLDHFLWRLK